MIGGFVNEASQSFTGAVCKYTLIDSCTPLKFLEEVESALRRKAYVAMSIDKPDKVRLYELICMQLIFVNLV